MTRSIPLLLSFEVADGKVKNFGGYVLEQCDGSSTRTQTAVSVDKAMKIKDGKFSVWKAKRT